MSGQNTGLQGRPLRVWLFRNVERDSTCVTIRSMDIREWDERYRSEDEPEPAPTPLLVKTAERLQPGRALDLACGTGRNALWLAEHDWNVTAVDGAPSAIGTLRQRAFQRGLDVDAYVA